MNTVSFECNDSVLPKITGILKQLELVTEKGQRRVVRIGGDEKVIDGSDEIADISINGVADSTPYISSIPLRKQKSQSTASTQVTQPSSISNPTTVVVTDSDDEISNDDRNVVREVVMTNVDKSVMFTAFDITKEARTRGLSERHRRVKKVVHEMYEDDEMLSYVRELIDIDGVSNPPFLYVPNGADPKDYFGTNGITGQLITM